MNANWDDDEFDVEEVYARHCEERAKKSKNVAASSGGVAGLSVGASGGQRINELSMHDGSCPWLRHSYCHLPRLVLPEYLSTLLPACKDFSKCVTGDQVLRLLATRGRACLQDIDSDLSAILRPIAASGFNGFDSDLAYHQSEFHEFATSSIAVMDVLTPKTWNSQCAHTANPDLPGSAGYLTESAVLECSAYLTEHLRRLSALHPKLFTLLSCVLEDSSMHSCCTLQLVRMLPLNSGTDGVATDAAASEQYLCHGQVETGFISLLVALSSGVEVHIGNPIEPNSDWEPFQFATAAGAAGPMPGVLVVGSTLERITGIPAAPWCLMTSTTTRPAKKRLPACLAVIRLCPRAALAARTASSALAVGPLLQTSLCHAPSELDRCTNDHLIFHTLFAVLHFLTLRQALQTASVARAFGSAELLADRIAAAAIPPKYAHHVLQASRLLKEVEVLDLTELAGSLPPFASLRAAMLATPKLRKLYLPSWPGFRETLKKLRPKLRVDVAPAPLAATVVNSAKISRKTIPRSKRSPSNANEERNTVSVSVHSFLGLFPSVLEDTPEWRQPQVARALSGSRTQFAAWLQVGRRRPPLLSLEGIDMNAPIAAMASAAAAHVGVTSGMALYFDGECLDRNCSLASYGLSGTCAVRQAIQLDAVVLAS